MEVDYKLVGRILDIPENVLKKHVGDFNDMVAATSDLRSQLEAQKKQMEINNDNIIFENNKLAELRSQKESLQKEVSDLTALVAGYKDQERQLVTYLTTARDGFAKEKADWIKEKKDFQDSLERNFASEIRLKKEELESQLQQVVTKINESHEAELANRRVLQRILVDKHEKQLA
jgi:hypothetical protein